MASTEHTSPRLRPARLVFYELEPRIAFDAAFGAAVVGEVTDFSVYGDAHLTADDSLTHHASETSDQSDKDGWDPATIEPPVRSEIVFIDAAVEDIETLLSGIDPAAEVVFLDADRDGIEQIAEVMGYKANVGAIHILAHGSSGLMSLGSGTLTTDAMDGIYASQLVGIGMSLSADADILIYGCDFASGETGRLAVSTLAGLTGADVAASDDLTGHKDLGGDWDLEYRHGSIEAEIFADQDALNDWDGVLAVGVDSTSTGTSSGGNFSVSHTTSGTDRLMLVAVSINQSAGSTVASVSYNGDALTLVGARESGSGGTAIRVEIWSLVNPDLATHTVNIAMSGTSDGNTAGVMTFSGVDQSTPLGTFASGAGGSGGAGSATVSSAADELVFAAIAVDDNVDYNLIPGGSQTERWDLKAPEVNGGGSTAVGAASVPMSWTWSGSDAWAVGGVSIKPSSDLDPVNGTPGPQTTNENTALVFNAGNSNLISITDDAGESLTVTLGVNNGTLTLSQTTGLTVSSGANGTASMTVVGTVENLNAALDGLQYDPTPEYDGGDTFTITTNDTTLYQLNIDANLRGFYKFISVDPGNDSSPAGTYDGTLRNGAAVVSDPVRGDVLSLDGIDDHVEVAGLFGNPTNVTLAGWVNLTSADTWGSDIVSLGDSVALRLDYPANAGNEGVHGFFYDGSNWRGTSSSQFIAGTGWHHIAYTYSDTGNSQKLYIDGIEVASSAYTDSISYTRGVNTIIGANGDGGNDANLNGLVDDVRIYNRALSAAEISNLANGPVNPSDSDNVAITVVGTNSAPTTSNKTISANEDTPYVFTVADFPFADADSGDALQQVQITSLVSVGSLKLSGVDVTHGQIISQAAIDAGNLTFAASPNAFGSSYDSFGFRVHDGTAYSSATSTISINNSTFNTNADGFVYADISNGGWADGAYDSAGGKTGGGLRIDLGGGVTGGVSSGGWSKTFNLANATEITVSTDFRLLMSSMYEADEYGEMYLKIDGVSYGNDTNSSLIRTVGDGNGGSVHDSGWLTYQTTITLAAGNHTIQLSANNNNSTAADEFIDAYFDNVTVTSGVYNTMTVDVAAVNDAPTGVPAITGTVTENETLTADTSGISDNDGLGAFSYQWMRDGVDIGGATGSTYTLGDADVSRAISVKVSYTDGNGTAEGPLTSAATAAVANVNDAPAGVPAITGTVTENETLTADTSGISDNDGLGAFSYQWMRDGVDIGGATGSTYTLGDADVGRAISVKVSYTDGNGTAEGPLTSAATAPVANVNDAPAGVPAITGTVTENETLTADTSGISDNDGLGAFSYQWMRDG
ncbi:DUF4347 domain-containing protein, partial [Hoeflea halophila]